MASHPRRVILVLLTYLLTYLLSYLGVTDYLSLLQVMYVEISTVYHFAFLGLKCGHVALFGKLTVRSEKILHTSMYELCSWCVRLHCSYHMFLL